MCQGQICTTNMSTRQPILHLPSHFTKSDQRHAQHGLLSPLIIPSPSLWLWSCDGKATGTVGISQIHAIRVASWRTSLWQPCETGHARLFEFHHFDSKSAGQNVTHCVNTMSRQSTALSSVSTIFLFLSLSIDVSMRFVSGLGEKKESDIKDR